ncbi:MAG: hypothetical protein QOE77_4205 [Blastocatellia bacterium]|nr:hypothetical protein [Blastocatellia bacterium]
MDPLAVLVAACPRTEVEGTWQRHVAARHAAHALHGRRSTGRWSTKDGYPVLYLGRPIDSVVVEAYRHLIDPVEDERLRAHLEPRVLVTCTIAATGLLDLREPSARLRLDLPLDILRSATSDRAAYLRCQTVARAAHHVGLNGILAPAATGMGETLALFTDIAPADQRPMRSAPDILWDQLPADPRHVPSRHLRVVETGP